MSRVHQAARHADGVLELRQERVQKHYRQASQKKKRAEQQSHGLQPADLFTAQTTVKPQHLLDNDRLTLGNALAKNKPAQTDDHQHHAQLHPRSSEATTNSPRLVAPGSTRWEPQWRRTPRNRTQTDKCHSRLGLRGARRARKKCLSAGLGG
jgi:hypothetical protein